jgi:hypothetical protein
VQKTSLYRHYDAGGMLLYVGIASSHIARLKSHKGKAGWFWDIARIEVEHFASRADALAAEAVAIRDENPVHNIMRPAVRDGTLTPEEKAIAALPDGRLPERGDAVGYLCIARQYLNRGIRKLRRAGVPERLMFIDVVDCGGASQPNLAKAVKAATHRGSRIVCGWPEEFQEFSGLLRANKIRVQRYG